VNGNLLRQAAGVSPPVPSHQSRRAGGVSPPVPTRFGRTLIAITILLAAARSARGQDDLLQREEAAFQAAVARAAASTVRIETVGGLERVGQLLIGEGPTTGVIVTPEGHIVSSAFNFIQQPSSILITLPDETKLSARLVATDHSRMIVLLKVDPPAPLTPAEAVPAGQVRVGQWSIAVGRTFEGPAPNVSVGIVSAVDRIWGRAIQTDAKISPSNYGGPLVDLSGRVMGILVPLSPQASTAVAGVEWYDSGIGFAIPLSQIHEALPRLSVGQDLHAGILGVNMKGTDIFADPPIIAACRPNSPAYEGGLKPDDRIVEVAGRPVVRQAQVKQLLGALYAGDRVRLVVARGDARIEGEFQLIDKLEPYVHPFLGLLPLRLVADAPPPGGVPVRYVYPDSPAAAAGIESGDVVVAAAGTPVANPAELLERLVPLSAGDKVAIDVRRGEAVRTIEVTLASLPEALPPALPPAHVERTPAAAAAQRGRFTIKLPESDKECLVYVPESYDPAVAHGLLMWFNAGGGYTDEELDALVARWKPHCDRADLILIAPRSTDGTRWDPPKDLPLVRKLADQVRGGYTIDPNRVVAHGEQGGGALACLLAFEHRDLVRGLAAVEAPAAGALAENEPIYRLAVYSASAGKSPAAPIIAAGVKRLQELKYPVTVVDLGDVPRTLTDDELSALVRWIDALDRF
jgi:serine protease Do